VRIDRSDVADVPVSAHGARRVRSAPDDPDAAGKDQGKAVDCDGPHNSSRAPQDSALRMDRTAAYHAAVDAIYRLYAIDHGSARMEKLEPETLTPAMRRTETVDPGRHLVGLEACLKGKDLPTEAAELENLQVPNRTTEHEVRTRDRTSDSHVVAQRAKGDACRGVAGTTPDLVHDADGPGYGNIGTAAEYLLTGAGGLPRGVSSILGRREGRSSTLTPGKRE
jgi:hypothetical protein